jgi:hypothetical protein
MHIGRRLPTLAGLAICVAIAGCGKGGLVSAPSAGTSPGSLPAGTVTKNTTRLGDGTPAGDAAAVARVVYPGLSPDTRPAAVALVDAHDWPAALAASALAAAPLRLPVLYTDGASIPAVTAHALSAMAPTGSGPLGGAQLVTVGGAGHPSGYRVRALTAANPAALAAAVAGVVTGTRAAKPAQVVIVASDGPPSYAMPAAGLAAESGAPILFVDAAGVPGATRAALAAMGHPALYVVGPDAVVSAAALSGLNALGTVKRIRGADAGANAIAVAQYTDRGFGWGVVDPGHGLVFVSAAQPLDAPAAAPLSANGDYGPILLVNSAGTLSPALAAYLSAIQPGYTSDPRYQPVRGVYNRGWLVGGSGDVTPATQARLDALLEISPRSTPPTVPATAP